MSENNNDNALNKSDNFTIKLGFYRMKLIDKNPYLWEIWVYNTNGKLFLDEIFYGQAAANGFSRCLRCMGYENRSNEVEHK